MNPTLQLNLSQQLKLNPQLQQSIKLLQLSQLALQQEIQYQLDSNPLLELIDDNYQQNNGNHTDLVTDTISPTAISSTIIKDPQSSFQSSQQKQLSQPSVDYAQTWNSQPTPESGENQLESQIQDKIGLREHLEWQIQMSSLTRVDMELAYYIIENINDAGFLTVSPAEIAKQIEEDFDHSVEYDEVHAIIHHVQQLEPLGCASNDLQEFLLLQLNAMASAVTAQQLSKIKLAIKLIKQHFEALRKHRYQDLIQRLSLTQQEMNEALDLIQHLRTQPNYQYIGEVTEYIRPDILVYKLNGQWQAQLAGQSTPQLDINHQYAETLGQSNNINDRQYLQQNLQKARWFMQSIEARNDTLKRVAEWIVQHQQNFFESGESALRPMRLKDLAKDLKLHESTISRACSDKYLQSPKGIYELKYFFSNAIPSTQGGEWSSRAIKNKIKQFLNAEPSRKPLSDIKLAELLQQEGISIARRTVAKYREALSIPPANQRKLYTDS